MLYDGGAVCIKLLQALDSAVPKTAGEIDSHHSNPSGGHSRKLPINGTLRDHPIPTGI